MDVYALQLEFLAISAASQYAIYIETSRVDVGGAIMNLCTMHVHLSLIKERCFNYKHHPDDINIGPAGELLVDF